MLINNLCFGGMDIDINRIGRTVSYKNNWVVRRLVKKSVVAIIACMIAF
jgi:hypothetical protein